MADTTETDPYQAIYKWVRSIPKGKVATYGQVAESIVDGRFSPREVGRALSFAPANCPWHRVVGAGGRILIARRSAELGLLQMQLLEREGVPLTDHTPPQIDMRRALWKEEQD